MPEARELQLVRIERIIGGVSRATWSLDVCYREEGIESRRGLILRSCESAYGSALGGPSNVEFVIYDALSKYTDLPVPKALWLEPTGGCIGYPFFISERIEGCESSPKLLLGDHGSSVTRRIAHALFNCGGELTKFDWRAAGLDSVLESIEPENCWERELAYWMKVIEASRYDTQPIVRLTIDWLWRHPPPPAQRVTLLSGDYRIGNFLYDKQGKIHAWLDWEMAHAGDPLEDLAWAFMPMWRFGTELICGVLTESEAIRIWEEASGLRVDSTAFRWWRIFQHVKAQGIWQAAVRAFSGGATAELSQAVCAVLMASTEDRALIDTWGWNT